MKIRDILAEEKLSLSFEVFPPKTDTAFKSVRIATEEIAKLSPSFMSVTYGAGGGTSRYTLDIAKEIKQKYSVPSLAHLTCVSSTKDTVKSRIAEIRAAGIENVMALRGDIPTELLASDRSGCERIEALCDTFCADISAEYEAELKPRFSPGYGDLPLDTQVYIMSFLEPQKNIGVFLTDSLMLTPSKSVTAFIAV